MARQYTTLANVRAYLTGITSGQVSDDSLLTDLIYRSSAAIDSHVCRGILAETVTETQNGNDTSSVFVRNYPITNVASVTVDGFVYQQSTDGFSFGFVWDDTRVYLRGGKFYRGIQNVVITYTGGFATVPYDVEMACIDTVVHHYKMRNHIGILSHSTNGVVTDTFIHDVPPHVKCKLERYVRTQTL